MNIATTTKLSPEETLKKAVEFFGPKGLGLEIKDQNTGCATFEGSGGGVFISTCAADKGTSVELESREWDYQVKEFIRTIH